MGYFFPIQLTQWALASSPKHPILSRYVGSMVGALKEVAEHTENGIQSPLFEENVFHLDPLELTGPAALTASVQNWLEESAGLRWNALSGLDDRWRE